MISAFGQLYFMPQRHNRYQEQHLQATIVNNWVNSTFLRDRHVFIKNKMGESNRENPCIVIKRKINFM